MKITIEKSQVLQAAHHSDVPEILLSENDNGTVRNYIQMVLFYVNNNNEQDFMQEEKLKSSLIETFELFPEFCGRLSTLDDGSLKVVCNNAGIHWVTATCEGTLSHLSHLKFPQTRLPDGMITPPPVQEGSIMKFQYTKCTGDNSVILSAAFHHSVTDAHGFFRFLKCWSQQCTGQLVNQPPSDRTIYSANGIPPQFDHPDLRLVSEEEKTNMKQEILSLWPSWTRGIFSAGRTSLEMLKEDISDLQKRNGIVSKVSTNDAICALIWTSVFRVRRLPPEAPVHIHVACNGRRRSRPPLPDTYVGNSAFLLTATGSNEEIADNPGGLGLAAAKIRTAVDEFTGERIQSWLNWVSRQENKSQIILAPFFCTLSQDSISTSSWVGVPVYEIDFGYGGPQGVRIPSNQPINNSAIIFPAPPPSSGVEVLLFLPKDDMEKIANHCSEFTKYFTFVG